VTLEGNFESILDRLNAVHDELPSLEQTISWLKNAAGHDARTNDFFYKGAEKWQAN
jgi:hypothetical protein